MSAQMMQLDCTSIRLELRRYDSHLIAAVFVCYSVIGNKAGTGKFLVFFVQCFSYLTVYVFAPRGGGGWGGGGMRTAIYGLDRYVTL